MSAQKKPDQRPVRRRTYHDQTIEDTVIGHKDGVETQHISEVVRPYNGSSSASGIANQKTKVNLKPEPVPLSPESLSEKIKELGALTAQAKQLGEEQRMHDQKAQQLEQQIKQGELKYGQMLQDSFELQQALGLKNKHIKEDKEARRQELFYMHTKTVEIRRILDNIDSIAREGNDR